MLKKDLEKRIKELELELKTLKELAEKEELQTVKKFDHESWAMISAQWAVLFGDGETEYDDVQGPFF